MSAPVAPSESQPEPQRRETIGEWLDRLEAAAAACASRREASALLLGWDVARAERCFCGEPLRRLHVVMLQLYSRFWGAERYAGRSHTDAEENNP